MYVKDLKCFFPLDAILMIFPCVNMATPLLQWLELGHYQFTRMIALINRSELESSTGYLGQLTVTVDSRDQVFSCDVNFS